MPTASFRVFQNKISQFGHEDYNLTWNAAYMKTATDCVTDFYIVNTVCYQLHPHPLH